MSRPLRPKWFNTWLDLHSYTARRDLLHIRQSRTADESYKWVAIKELQKADFDEIAWRAQGWIGG